MNDQIQNDQIKNPIKEILTPTERLDKRIDSLNQKISQAHGQYDFVQRSISPLKDSLQKTITRLSYKPEMDMAMSALQDRVHGRTIGSFERILTGIVQDVLGSQDEVIIKVDTKNQATSLSISVTNNGQPENAFYGRGGSISNVLSLGLRFLALSRCRLRKFIVLDEVDCWLEPHRVKPFMNVICALSQQLGIQVMMISHKNLVEFADADQISVIQMKSIRKDKSILIDQVINPKKWEQDQDGVRSVSLKNFMAYKDVTLPLSPGVTVITGPNDAGKSASIIALRCLIRDEWEDNYVRHNQTFASVELDLGPDGRILSTRDTKGKRKNYHAIFLTGAKPIAESQDAETPEWIGDLGFDIGPMDIQIGLQKKPVFMLDKSGTQQAQMLSIGKESKVFMAMQAIYKSDLKKLNDYKKQAEKELSQYSEKLTAIEKSPQWSKNIQQIKSQWIDIQKENQLIENGEKLLNRINHLTQSPYKPLIAFNVTGYQPVSKLINLINKIETISHVQNLKPFKNTINKSIFLETEKLSYLINKIESLSKIAQLKPVEQVPDIKYKDVKLLKDIGSRIFKLSKISQIKPFEPFNNSIKTESLDIEKIIDRMTSICNGLTALSDEREMISNEILSVQKEKQLLIDSLDGYCPTCGQLCGESHLTSNETINNENFELSHLH